MEKRKKSCCRCGNDDDNDDHFSPFFSSLLLPNTPQNAQQVFPLGFLSKGIYNCDRFPTNWRGGLLVMRCCRWGNVRCGGLLRTN